MTKVIVGGKQVLSSGTVLSRVNETLELYPLSAPAESYKIELVFPPAAADAGNTDPSFAMEIVGEFLRLTFYNFAQPLGVGNAAALYVANHLGRKVLLDLVCRVIGQGDNANRSTSYTFFD